VPDGREPRRHREPAHAGTDDDDPSHGRDHTVTRPAPIRAPGRAESPM
jgi:hypothetical protein